MKWLKAWLITPFALWIVIELVVIFVTTEWRTQITFFAVLLFAVSLIAYLIQLGRLASMLKASPIPWVTLTIMTIPVGPFVSYFLMRKKLRRSLAA